MATPKRETVEPALVRAAERAQLEFHSIRTKPATQAQVEQASDRAAQALAVLALARAEWNREAAAAPAVPEHP